MINIDRITFLRPYASIATAYILAPIMSFIVDITLKRTIRFIETTF